MHIKLPLMSITQKVLLALALSIVLIMSGAGILYFSSEKNKAVAQMHRAAEKTAERLANSLIYPLWNINRAEIEKTLELEMADENMHAIYLVDEFDQFLVGRIKDPQGQIRNAAPGENGFSQIPGTLMTIEKKIIKGSEHLGEVTLFFSDLHVQQYLHQLARQIMLLTVMLALFTILTLYYTLHRIVLTPILTLQAMTQRLRASLGGAVPVPSPDATNAGDEIICLRRNFDAMAEELTQSQARLRQTAEHLQTLTDGTPDTVISLNDDSRIIDVNQTFVRMFGYARESILNKTLSDFGADHLSGKNLQGSLDQALSELPVEFEWQARRQDGTSFPAFVRLLAMHSGEERRILAVITDITERIRANEALRISEARLRAIGDNLPGGMIYQVIASPDGTRRFTYVSRGVEKMHEITADDVIHNPAILYEQIAEEDRPALIQEEMKCIRHMGTFSMEARSILPSGRIRWMRMTSQPRLLPTGEVIYDGVEIDITDLKRTEEALRESEERFSKAFQANPAPMVITDLATGRFLDANDRWLHLIGYTREELIGATSLELNIYTDPGTRERMVAKLREERRFKEADLRLRTKSGCIADVLWSAEVINLSGHEAMLSLLIDVTERKQAEQKLLESLGLFQAMLESTANGILVTNLEQEVVHYNHLFAAMWRLPEEVLIAHDDQPVLQFVLDQLDDPEAFLRGVQELYDNPGEERRELILFRDGRVFERYSIPTYRGMEIVGRVWSFKDITLEKQAEEALRESEAKYRRLHESMTDAFIRVDLNGHIVETNPSFQVMTGYTEEELYQLHYENLTPGKWHKPEEEITQNQVMTRGYSDVYEKEFIHKNGTVFSIELKAFLIRNDVGQPTGRWAIVRDITERKRTEEALRASELRYRTLFENTPVGLSVMQPNRSFVYFNTRFTEMVGYTLADLPDKDTWFKKAYPDPGYRRQVMDLWKGDFPENKSGFIRGERILKVRTKDGRTKVIHFRTAVMANGEHLTSYEDITDLQELNEALRESEARYRTLFDGAPVGIGVGTASGTVLAANEGMLHLMQAPSKEAITQIDLRKIYSDPGERVVLLEKIARDGYVRNYETKLRRPDGSLIDVIMTLNPFVYDGQNAILSVIQDITWKKEAEEEMRHLKNYLANIIDSMPSLLVGVDRNTRVTQWNIAAAHHTNIKAEDAVGRYLEDVLPFMAHQAGLVREALRTNEPQAYPKMQSRTGGENRYTDIVDYPLITNGAEGAVIRIDDVTDRVRIEEMMIQSEKMLSVGGLAAGMAHEINNPLGAIMAAAQNVLRRVSPDLPSNVQAAEACSISLTAVRDYLEQRQIPAFLEDIRTSAGRASRIVTNMLSFSRKNDGSTQEENLAAILDRTLLLAGSDYDLKKKHDFRQIEIIREYDPDTPDVMCQASKLQQVFLNILRNGAEAMEETSSPEHPPRFTLRVFPHGDVVRIEIADNGPGIDDHLQRRVFEPFFTTKPPGIGTGLGLSVSYFIVTETHHGSIWAESAPGWGARFIIELPVKEHGS